MYYICKRNEWHPATPVNGRWSNVIVKAIESLHGQRVEEDQLRFALDVHAPEFDKEPWSIFKECLPDLLAARRINMDKNEALKLRMEAVLQIKEALEPLKEIVKGEVLGALSDVSRKWGIDGLEWGLAQIAEKRLVASVMRLAKDEKICQCGHHENAHRADPGDARAFRKCRLCNTEPCEDFGAAGRKIRW